MKKQSSKIVIIGNGNMGKAFHQNLRVQQNSTLLGRKEIEIFSPKTHKKIEEAECILFTVKPKDIVSLLVFLKNNLLLKKNQTLIFLVSGITKAVIKTCIPSITENQIVIMTSTIGVKSKSGIIIHSEMSGGFRKTHFTELCKSMCTKDGVLEVPVQKVIQYVTLVGAMAAFDAKYIEVVYSNKYKHILFSEFLYSEILLEELEKWEILKKEVVKKIFTNTTYIETSFSTLKSLQESISCVPEIKKYISCIATKGGCTEEGLKKLHTILDFTQESIESIIKKVHRKTVSFKKEIRKSVEITVQPHTTFKEKTVFQKQKKAYFA